MKRIIDGYLYDTDTAELLYRDLAKTRFYYMTPNRRFFIVFGTGRIEVTNENVIKDILGTYDIDKYVEIFGEPQEG